MSGDNVVPLPVVRIERFSRDEPTLSEQARALEELDGVMAEYLLPVMVKRMKLSEDAAREFSRVLFAASQTLRRLAAFVGEDDHSGSAA